MKQRRRYLVTAGNTREMIDLVRDWGNIFTGNTGYKIARALADAGGEVDCSLATADLELIRDAPQRPIGLLRGFGFASHAQLKTAIAALIAPQPYKAVFMTAAVSDYIPARVYEVLQRGRGETADEVWVVRDDQAGKCGAPIPRSPSWGSRPRRSWTSFGRHGTTEGY